jgi:signal transduction histidine kinase
VVTALALGTLAALVLNPMFVSPFPVLLGRMLFVAVLLLLAFTAAGHWQPRGLPAWWPRWLQQVLAVVLAAPLAAFVASLLAVGGDAAEFFGNEARLHGFVWIAVTAAILGALFALGSLLRERDAQTHALQLQVALERAERERQQADAQLALLRSQIEPHFLFNTLANVQALVETGSPRASAVLASLIAYLRAAMPRLQAGAPTLGDEAALVRAYLELMHLRMPDRLDYAVDLPPALATEPFPAMALLTLVENAVRHGIDPSEQGGRIEVGAARDGAQIRLWVQDSGVGLDPAAAPGTGLANLRARLGAHYGPAARLELAPLEPHGLRAEIVLPGVAS